MGYHFSFVAEISTVYASVNHTGLITSLQQGSITAFDVLYQQHHQAVFRNIYKLVPQQEVAEDLLQEVFLALWEHRASLDTTRPAAGWLFVVSYNKSLNWLKKNLRESIALQAMPHTEIATEEGLVHEELYQQQLQALNNAVDMLPLRKKQAFRLCRLEGHSYEEAGSLLGISAATVKEYVKSAAQLIRQDLFSEQGPSSLASVAGLVMLITLP